MTSLLSRIGDVSGDNLGRDLFDIISAQVPLEMCTVIAYESGRNARSLSHAGRVRTGAIAETVSTYLHHFVPLDGIQRVIAHEGTRIGGAAVWCQRMASDEIESAQYRRLCYERPGICERLAILCRYEDQRWLSIKFYRGKQSGPFSDREIEQLEAFAPLAAQAVKLFYSNYLHERQLVEVLRLRLARACPTMTAREKDLVRGILEGHSTAEIAADMGVREMTLRTYQKRLYRKLGISSQRELIPLCTS